MKKLTFNILFCLVCLVVLAPGSHPGDPLPLRGVPPEGGSYSGLNKIEAFLETAPLTRTNLQLALDLNGIVAPAVVMAQSRLETGNYESSLCQEYNNLFGMNFPRVRPTTAAGSTEYGFAFYLTWYDCVKDMRLFQEWYRTRGRDLSNYFVFLAAIGYAEDPEYINKLSVLCTI